MVDGAVQEILVCQGCIRFVTIKFLLLEDDFLLGQENSTKKFRQLLGKVGTACPLISCLQPTR